jgi:hypothetical protein
MEGGGWSLLEDTGSMKKLYAHDATVRMDQTDDPDAVGAAVTVALCGHRQTRAAVPAGAASHECRT